MSQSKKLVKLNILRKLMDKAKKMSKQVKLCIPKNQGLPQMIAIAPGLFLLLNDVSLMALSLWY